MKRFILIGSLFLTVKGWAVVDPLSSQFMPTVDTNPSDYSTAFGTITVTTTSYRVFQSSVAPGNVHWVISKQFRNEIHSYQIHATPSVNISSYSVSVGSLTNVQNGVSISTANMTVYREWYINVATPTSLSTVTYSGGIRTMMPHELIPAVDPYYHQQTNAFPVAITAGMTQSVLIDVYTSSTTPSGWYAGQVTVSSGAATILVIPVLIGVWDWAMPSTASLPMTGSAFGYNGFNNVAYGLNASVCNYPGAANSCDTANRFEMIDGTAQMLDNKWQIDNPFYGSSPAGDFSVFVSTVGPYIDGTPGHIATILSGAQLGMLNMQDSFTPTNWQIWASTFSAHPGWFPKLSWYICDESQCISSLFGVGGNARLSRTYSTPIIPNLATMSMATAISLGATNYVDRMVPNEVDIEYPGNGNLRSTYNAWLASNSLGVPRQLGTYQSCSSANTCNNGVAPANSPGFSNYHIDGTPVANRSFQTYMFVNNFSFELYYAVDECDTGSGCFLPNGTSAIDPWHGVYLFSNQGPGTLLVPSTGTIVTTSTGTPLGVPIWCPTMTLKFHRDGMDDYEIENYLTNLGYGSFVNTQIATWYTNAFTFSSDPSKIDTARVAMGDKIQSLVYPSGGGPSESCQGVIQRGALTAQ